MNKIIYFNIIFLLSASMALSGCLEKNAEKKIKEDLLSSSMGMIKSADIHYKYVFSSLVRSFKST
jgi:hypothetical protein